MAMVSDKAMTPVGIKEKWRARPAEHSSLQPSDLHVVQLVATVPDNLGALSVSEQSNHLLAVLSRLL